jgi:hypothetical protein
MKMRVLLICLATGAGILAWVGRVSAQDQNSCSRRVMQDRRDLARAIDQHGYYSSQAQHERSELQRDEARCGYSGNGERRDDRWRDNGHQYGERPYDNYGRRGVEGPAYDIGYRDGLAFGQRDRDRGKAFRPDRNDYYEDADRGYQKRYGDKGLYKSQYREAFQRGYTDGYYRH